MSETPPIPVPKHLAEAFKKTQVSIAEYLQSDQCFENLPVVHMVDKEWQARGIERDDAVFLLIEVLGLFEARERMRSRQLMDVIENSVELMNIATSEINESVQAAMQLRSYLEENNKQAAALEKQHKAVVQLTERFVKAVPTLHEQIFTAVSTLNDQGIWGRIIQVATIIFSILCGAALLYIYQHYF